MQMTLEEKLKGFLDNTDFDEFLSYYYTHNDSDVLNNYNLTNGLFKLIKSRFNLKKSREQIKEIQMRTWEEKPSSIKNKQNNLLKQISKEDLEYYYIIENNTFESTIEHFNLITSDLLFLLNYYDLKKDKRLSKEHADRTRQIKYGDKNYNNREKSKQTCLEKYGVDNPFKDKQRMRNSYISKLGVDHPMHDEEIVKKCVSNHDYESSINKGHRTNLLKYGVENVTKLDFVKDKIRDSLTETFKEKYGCTSYFTMPGAKLSNGSKDSNYNMRFKELLESNSIKFEREFPLDKYRYDFAVGNNLIEINPSPTHNSTWSPFSDKPLDKNYHFNKYLSARDGGYRCICVWDWDDEQKVINLLLPREKVNARECVVREVSSKDSAYFLNTYHLQGNAKSNIRLGLYYNDNLVSLMTFGNPRYNKNYEYELIRLCSSRYVVGGNEKLFKHFVNKYNPSSIISYCDNSKFLGNVYITLGFKLKSYGSPSKHWYNIKTGKHITDNLLRQRGFDQLFGTNYGKGTSNETLMLENGFVEVYDCGQSVYEYIKE